jgi:hypothetical protein
LECCRPEKLKGGSFRQRPGGVNEEVRFTRGAEALQTAGRFDLVVVNPGLVAALCTKGMWGNGTSNRAHLIVNYKY